MLSNDPAARSPHSLPPIALLALLGLYTAACSNVTPPTAAPAPLAASSVAVSAPAASAAAPPAASQASAPQAPAASQASPEARPPPTLPPPTAPAVASADAPAADGEPPIDWQKVFSTDGGEEAARRALEARRKSGKATAEELKMLRAICRHQGQARCVKQANDALDKLQKGGDRT